LKIICAGDSLTYGYGVRENECWVSLLQANSSHEIINKGVNGDTTSSLLNRSYEDILSLKPCYAIIMCGTNDFLMGSSLNRTFDNIKLLYEEMINSSIKVILMTPPPVFSDFAKERWSSFIDYTKVNLKIKELGELIKDFSIANDIKSINLFKFFEKYQNEFNNLFSDGIHLTAKGHLLIYNNLENLKLLH